MNTISKDTPLTREYLQSLKENYDERILKPIFDEFLQHLRKQVITAAQERSIGLTLGFPDKLRKHFDKFEPILKDNFPGCELTFSSEYNSITIDWDVPTLEVGKGET
jgi:hypothetical protein